MFRDRLQRELDERRGRNGRYSLRAFARHLGLEHASLSQILRGRRRVTRRCVQRLGARLGMSAAEIASFCVAEDEEALLEAIRSQETKADVRWLASRLGIRIDAVNIALQSLLRKRRVMFRSSTQWEAV